MQHARKSAPASPEQPSSLESSDDEKPRPKAEGRADRFFYETLMCQPDHPKFSPDALKFRREHIRNKLDYARKYREATDTDKNASEDYSGELGSKDIESTVTESNDVLNELATKKRGRRNKMTPLAHVVSFMGKSSKRN